MHVANAFIYCVRGADVGRSAFEIDLRTLPLALRSDSRSDPDAMREQRQRERETETERERETLTFAGRARNAVKKACVTATAQFVP